METLSECRYSPTRSAVFIGASRYRRHSYGANHPLSIPRVSLTFDLINAYGALLPGEYRVGRPASTPELCRFHTEDYVRAIKRCEALEAVSDDDRQRHNIGNLENPWFPGFFHTPALATGSSLLGAEEVLAGRNAFSPAGGMHHARPDRAQGFCYFNDAVLAILRLREAGLRVLYIDIDAHHGDGVEEAFRNDPAVFTFSLHMDTSYAYPFRGGTADDWGDPKGSGACLNVPLPQGANDSEYALLFETLWPQVLRIFRPQAVVLQAGTDILYGDPLGKLRISTRQFLAVVARIAQDSARLLVLGGGGYHPLLLARCWTGVWSTLSGRALPQAIPPAGQTLLRAVGWDQDEDEDYFPALFESRLEGEYSGPVRDEIARLLERIRRNHPLMGGL
ncbi:MAG: acetoin utilization protein AcuC [Acidiferrobacterales bacterium]